MNLNIYNSGNAYLDQNLDHLKQFPAINSLLIGIAQRGDHGLYFDVKKDEVRYLSGMMKSSRNLILAEQKLISYDALNELANYFRQQNIRPPGIIAPINISKEFIGLWKERTSCKSVLDYNEMIYKADRTLKIKMPAGNIHLADRSNYELISEWVFSFSVDAGLEEDLGRAQRIAEEKIGNKEFYLWMVRDEPVSMASTTRPTGFSISINSVYTPNAFRRKGYATACVHAITSEMLKSYSMVTLFTDLKNPTSNSIYQQIGYVPVKEFLQEKFIYRHEY